MAFNGYDGYGDSSWDEGGDDPMVQCEHCPALVRESNYENHLQRVHKCDECGNFMPQKSLSGHKMRNHMEKCLICGTQMLKSLMPEHLRSHYRQCQYCNNSFRQADLEKHIQDSHSMHAVIGMIRLEKITGAEFNRLVAEKRIFSDDHGNLFKRM